MIVQVFAVYAIIMNTIGLFVSMNQIDFMMIRMSADLMVNYYTCHRFMRFKTVNEELYSQYIKSHCADAVHYTTDVDGGDGSRYCSTTATTPPRAVTPEHAARSASTVGIRRAASASARTPSSDHFEGMPRQSLVPVSHETLKLYGSSDGAKDRVVVYRQHDETNNQDVFTMHSPRDSEHETSKLFTTKHS